MQFAEKWEGKKPGAAAAVPIVLRELQILNRFFSLPKIRVAPFDFSGNESKATACCTGRR
jgi:hypothetical protein